MDNKNWDHFITLCKKAVEKNLLKELLELILTHDEIEAISGRTIIIEELLKKEKTQREIAEHFQISIAKITRGSNALKRLDPKLKEFFDTCLKEYH